MIMQHCFDAMYIFVTLSTELSVDLRGVHSERCYTAALKPTQL